jgi:ParB-like chromosome segregation protein Spo0J
MAELVIETVGLENLVPHPRNVRQGDVGAIVESLKHHGQYRPIVVQRSTGNILAGNHTWRAMRELGWTEGSVTYVDVDDEEALRILLIDNRSNDLAIYDDSGLAELLKELAENSQGLEGTGFDGDDLDDLLFRLKGDSGTMGSGLNAQEALKGYEERGIKSFVLPFPANEWEKMNVLWAKLREEMLCCPQTPGGSMPSPKGTLAEARTLYCVTTGEGG